MVIYHDLRYDGWWYFPRFGTKGQQMCRDLERPGPYLACGFVCQKGAPKKHGELNMLKVKMVTFSQ